MNLKKEFEKDLFNLINRYENSYNISLDSIHLKKQKDALGEKVTDLEVSYKELEVKVENKKTNFITHVFLPTVVIFLFVSIVLEFFQ